jgi:nucleoside-diphosphate-sugar epimerase
MKVLVTGSEGLVGKAVVSLLMDVGFQVVRYDLELSQNILDTDKLADAVVGCDAIGSP